LVLFTIHKVGALLGKSIEVSNTFSKDPPGSCRLISMVFAAARARVAPGVPALGVSLVCGERKALAGPALPAAAR